MDPNKTTVFIDFDSSAFSDLASFEFMKRHIISGREHLAGVRVSSGGFSFGDIPADTFGSLDAVQKLTQLWIECFLNGFQRRRAARFREITTLINKLSLFKGQSAEMRLMPMREMVEEIGARIMALGCDMEAVHIRERIQLTTDGKYDHAETDLAFLRGTESRPYLIFGTLRLSESLRRLRTPFNLELQSMLLQYHLGADLLEMWTGAQQQISAAAAKSSPPHATQFITTSYSHERIWRMRSAQRM